MLGHGLRFLHYIPLDRQLHGMFIGTWLRCPHVGNYKFHIYQQSFFLVRVKKNSI
jgi:hypothetical protein